MPSPQEKTAGVRSALLALAIFISVVATIQAGWCPEKYRRYSLEHSFCLRDCCSCAYYKRGITPALKNQILYQHNSYRSKVAGGQSYGVDHLPRATNMLEMVWDDELATIAQKWVDSCKITNDCELCRMVDRFAVGQSVVQYEGSMMDSQDYDMQFFTYFNALETLKKEQVSQYTKDAEKVSGVTQLLWAKTWRIGCGFLYFRDHNGRKYSVLICNYGPRGNVVGEEVYKAGKACSACPANTCCGDACKKHGITANYHGLCKVIDETLAPEGNVAHEKTGKEIFYCSFNGESDCSATEEGADRWYRNMSTGGSWISTNLGSGAYAILKFEQPIVSKSGKMCLIIETRSGPTSAGDAYNYELTGKLEEEGKYITSIIFPPADNRLTHTFHNDYFQPTEFPKNRGVKLTLSFSVPLYNPKQYIEIKRIVVVEKDCPKMTTTEGSWVIVSG